MLLKMEMEPFNLLMALVETEYTIAEFTKLDIEEIRSCLALLEAFHKRVRNYM